MSIDSEHRGGFTLFEVMMAVAIVALITGTLFLIVQGLTVATGEVHRINVRYGQGLAMLDILRGQMRNLPPQTAIVCAKTPGDNVSGMDLILSNSPSVFGEVAGGGAGLVTIIRTEPQPNGLKRLVALFPPPDQTPAASAAQEENRMILLTDVRNVEWTFTGWADPTPMTNWTDTTTRPRMIRIVLELNGLIEPLESTMTLPQLASVPFLPPLGANQSAVPRPPAGQPQPTPPVEAAP